MKFRVKTIGRKPPRTVEAPNPYIAAYRGNKLKSSNKSLFKESTLRTAGVTIHVYADNYGNEVAVRRVGR